MLRQPLSAESHRSCSWLRAAKGWSIISWDSSKPRSSTRVCTLRICGSQAPQVKGIRSVTTSRSRRRLPAAAPAASVELSWPAAPRFEASAWRISAAASRFQAAASSLLSAAPCLLAPAGLYCWPPQSATALARCRAAAQTRRRRSSAAAGTGGPCTSLQLSHSAAGCRPAGAGAGTPAQRRRACKQRASAGAGGGGGGQAGT